MRTFHSDLSWNFLVSSPASTAYEFKSTVVFLVEDGPETSYGVIINRPLDKCISEFSDAVADPDLGAVEVYEGGPVGITELKLGAFCMGDFFKKYGGIIGRNMCLAGEVFLPSDCGLISKVNSISNKNCACPETLAGQIYF